MNFRNLIQFSTAGLGLLATGMLLAQPNRDYMPDPMEFPMEFENSRAHYDYLLDHYEGGVTHD